jgi:thiamine pyrophosphate-dependent acetolactate synthase large subunit-like protein
MTETTTGEALIRLLEAYGVDVIFGIPGVHTLEMYRGLGNSRIRHVTPRHEQGAGFMAEGYARLTGRPGVCLLITGPGMTNAATPIANAYADSVPMLVLSSVNARADLRQGRGRLHEITDQRAAIAPLCAFSQTIMTPSELPEAMSRAFALFQTQRPRPVHLELPLDVLVEPATFPITPRRPVAAPSPDGAALDEMAERLSRAQRPLIIAGGGTVKHPVAMRELVDRLNAPIALTTAAKGVVPDDHPLCLGGCLARTPAHALIAQADVVLAIGTELGETDSWIDRLPIDGELLRIDIDPAVLVRDYPAAVALQADAGAALAGLLARLAPRADAGAANRAATARTAIHRPGEGNARDDHRKVLDAIRRAVPADGAVFSDMTQIAYAGNLHYPCPEPRGWQHPNGYGTLGFALPAAIGAKVAEPERAVVALAGDGGFMFAVQEVATAVELEQGLPIVIWNNDGFRQIRDGMVRRGVPEIGVNLRNPDFQMLGRAFGCHVAMPGSLEEITQEVAAAFGRRRPSLIEIRQDAAFLA